MRAILLDLDDTLVPDHSDFLAAVDDVAAVLGAPAGMGARPCGCGHSSGGRERPRRPGSA